MPEAAVLGGMSCAFAITVVIGAIVGAVFLRAAIALYNKMVGGAMSPSGVPEPAFGKAIGITFVTSLVNAVVSFLIGLITSAGAEVAGRKGVDVVAQLIAFPVSLLIMATMLSALLPTTFGRAILVTLCYMLIVLIVVGVCVLVVIAIGVGLGVNLKGA
jgi:hypothetical protein